MADGITGIAVEGFKSIANRQEIEIAPNFGFSDIDGTH